MPLDTPVKRRSSVGLLQPWQPNIPSPLDTPGITDQGEQQQIAWTYSGILAGPAIPVIVVITIEGTFAGAPALSGTWSAMAMLYGVMVGAASVEGMLAGAPCLTGTWDDETALTGTWSSGMMSATVA